MNKSTLIALAVFGALALAWGLTREKQVSEGVQKLSFTTVNADALVAIEVGGHVLQARDGGWTVDKQWDADRAVVDAFAHDLATLKAEDLVTERTERHAEFEVDQGKGVVVKASTSSGVVRDLVVGRASKSGGVYLRQAGASAVFNSQSGLASHVRHTLRDWRDKRIETVASAELARVQVSPASGTAFALAREGEEWKLEGATPPGFRFDPDAAKRLASQLTSLTAQDFALDDEGLKTPSTITLTTKAGVTRTLTLGAKRADGAGALKLEGAQVWVLPAWVSDTLRIDLEGLRDLRPLRFEPKDVEQLTLVAPKGKTIVRKEGATWKLVEPKSIPAGFEFDAQMVETQLARLAGTRAARVADGTTKASLATPMVELKLKTSQASLRFGAQAGSANELHVKGNDELTYVIQASQKSWLEGGLDLFKKPPPMPQGNIQGLDQLPPEIRAQLEAQLRQQQGH